MSDPTTEDLIGREAAALLLEIPLDQLDAMIAEGMLSPVADTEPPTFRRFEVVALREAGG